ncbi:MAG: DUF5979 domain-containing protein [Erythrobacter sp.]
MIRILSTIAFVLLAVGAVVSPAIAAPGNLVIEKERIGSGNCHGAVVSSQANPNHCDFMILIHNLDTQVWSGPITISDQIYFGGQASTIAPTVVSAGNGWTCTVPGGWGSTEVICSNPNVSIQPGQFHNFPITLNLPTPAPIDANCARVLIPQVNNLSTGCVAVGATTGRLEVTKTFAPNAAPANFSGVFEVTMQCDLPTPHQVTFSLPVTGTQSPPVILGSNCTLTETPPTAPLPTGCNWSAPAYPLGNTVTMTSSAPTPTQMIRVQNAVRCIGTGVSIQNPAAVIDQPAPPRVRVRRRGEEENAKPR